MSIQMHQPVIKNHGMFAEHDVVCAVCGRDAAVLNMNEAIFEPCWSCQSEGWTLTKTRKSWWKR